MGQLRLALRELRQREEELQPKRKKLLTWLEATERNIPICGPNGQPQVKEALIRDLLLVRETDRNGNVCSGRAGRRDGRVGTEQSEFPETPTGSDGRGHLHDSDGSKTLKTICAVFWDLGGGKNDSRWNREGDGFSKRSNRHRIERQASSRTAHGIWTKATVGERCPPMLGNDGFAIGDTPGV